MTNIFKAPPEEKEITNQWKEIKVSICMLSFNHGNYIEQALNSILNQKTEFGFEVLLHDDASTDNSQEIIKKYQRKYPNIIKAILQEENQYSQGIHPSTHYNYPRASLEYVAICEGDDCWLDETKLQTQIKLLEEYKEINLSFHQAVRKHYLETDAPDKIIGIYGDSNKVVPYNDIIFRTQGWIPYASCIFRKPAKDIFFGFIKNRSYLTVGDLYFQLFGSLYNGAIYIAKPMSLYRFATPGSWTKETSENQIKKAKHEIAMICSYYEINEITEKKIESDIHKLILQRLLWLFNPTKIHENDSPIIYNKHTLPQEIIKKLNINFLLLYFENIKKHIIGKLNTLNQSNKSLIIYGCGSGCKTVLNSISNNKIKKIIDRDKKIVGQTINEIPVISLESIKDESNYEIIISVLSCSKTTVKEIKNISKLANNKIHFIFDEAINYIKENPINPTLLKSMQRSLSTPI